MLPQSPHGDIRNHGNLWDWIGLDCAVFYVPVPSNTV